LVDTSEFRCLLQDIQDYRSTALGLIARHLHRNFHQKEITCKAFWDAHQARQSQQEEQPVRTIQPHIQQNLRWNVDEKAVVAEMQRQNCDRVDFKFCLNWHAHEFQNDGPLVTNLATSGAPSFSNNTNALAALVHFMVLEHLELISSEDGGMTVLGNVLKDTPRNLQEPCLVALEMMKFGVLSGEPFDAAQAERPFPQQVGYPTSPVEPRMKAMLLLGRVMSLVPMKLKNDMWNAHVEFDLAAFHSLVRILKRTLRQIVEASLVSVLLPDLSRVKLLPPGFMCATPKKEDHLQAPALLPTFMLPRACMGIVVRFFLDYPGDGPGFQRDILTRFPCCAQPVEDLKLAFHFWADLRRCVDAIAEPLGAEELNEDMKMAEGVLRAQQSRLGLNFE